MKSYKILYHKKAKKFIQKNKDYGLKFFKAFKEISENKDMSYKYDIKKYHSKENNFFRLRIGKYRAIFQVSDEKITIYVFDIDSRGNIYK